MISTLASNPSPCCTPAPPSYGWTLIEQVTAIALAALACYSYPLLFLPCFVTGICLQALHFSTSDPDPGKRMGCSRGLMEQLTRIHMPRPVSLATDAAVLACHIHCHAPIFVPIVALYSGASLAQSLHKNTAILYGL